MSNNPKRITEGTRKLSAGHVVAYTQTGHVGYFAKVELTTTEYLCSCGRSLYTSTRFLTKELAGHDNWKTPEQRIKDAASFQELMETMEKVAANA
jgi:hypothetical protein